MAGEDKRLLVCDCEGTMRLDADLFASASGRACGKIHSQLCRREAHAFAKALDGASEVVVACGQEAETFTAIAEDAGWDGSLGTVDIRDRAGWSAEGAEAGPKMAALLAAEAVRPRPALEIGQASQGVALLIGPAEVAFEAEKAVGDRLGLTLLVTDGEGALPPARREAQIVTGNVRRAHGWLGAFGVEIDGFAEAEPAGRGGLRFGPRRDGAQSDCDLIIDLSGGAPLFPAWEKRDGYLCADPADPAAVAKVLLAATGLVGDFEKPLYVKLDPALCAHSRSRKEGCDRCLQLCPTAAISPDGDAVRIEPNICAGCGACAAACPSSAITYDYPEESTHLRRVAAMLRAYRAAGGEAPRLLLHDAAGYEIVAASARFGRGLPADVLPLELYEIAGAGHGLVMAALAMGCESVTLLAADGTLGDHRAALDGQLTLARALAEGAGLEGARIALVEGSDPDLLEEALYGADFAPSGRQAVQPIGRTREIVRQSMEGIAASTGVAAGPVPLSHDMILGGVPYGNLTFDAEACTLCLACVSQCPSGALMDSPDKPQLAFVEDACLQCGICTRTCPENALVLDPRFLNAPEAKQRRVLKEEEPFCCVECGKPFGTRSTVERISEKLGGKHWMFADDSRLRLIQMCDDCRVRAQFKAADNPFQMGERPRVRTTEDYLEGRVKGEDDETVH